MNQHYPTTPYGQAPEPAPLPDWAKRPEPPTYQEGPIYKDANGEIVVRFLDDGTAIRSHNGAVVRPGIKEIQRALGVQVDGIWDVESEGAAAAQLEAQIQRALAVRVAFPIDAERQAMLGAQARRQQARAWQEERASKERQRREEVARAAMDHPVLVGPDDSNDRHRARGLDLSQVRIPERRYPRTYAELESLMLHEAARRRRFWRIVGWTLLGLSPSAAIVVLTTIVSLNN